MPNKEQTEQIRNELLKQIEKLPNEQASGLAEHIKNASPEELEEFIKQNVKQPQECLFCAIAKGNVETIKIYEDAEIIAFIDIYPITSGHTIVAPKQHYESFEDIPDSILTKILFFIKNYIPALLEVTKALGYNIYFSKGEIAGQRLNHFSLNIIPRYDKDNVNFEFSRQKADKKELEKIGDKLSKAAQKLVYGKIEEKKAEEAKKHREKNEDEAKKSLKHMKRRIP